MTDREIVARVQRFAERIVLSGVIEVGDIRDLRALCDTVTRLTAENERLREENAALKDAACSVDALNLSGKKGEPWKASVSFGGHMAELLVAGLVDLFKAKGGINYVDASIRDTRDNSTYFVVVGPMARKIAAFEKLAAAMRPTGGTE